MLRSSLLLHVQLTKKVAAAVTRLSAGKKNNPSSVMHLEVFSTSLVKGVIVRLLGRWGISR